jgi:hypothetical protein
MREQVRYFLAVRIGTVRKDWPDLAVFRSSLSSDRGVQPGSLPSTSTCNRFLSPEFPLSSGVHQVRQAGLHRSACFFFVPLPNGVHFPDSVHFLYRSHLKRQQRHTAHVVHLQDSQSGGWLILRDDSGLKFFAHRNGFLDPNAQPAPGWNVRFTILPPLPEPLKRATEVEILKATRDDEALAI